MATRIPEGKHKTGRSYMTGNKCRFPPSNKKQALPLCVSVTWERTNTTPTPMLRLCILNKEKGLKLKLGRGLIRKGVNQAALNIYDHLTKHGYSVSNFHEFVEQVKSVIREESVKYKFNVNHIPDFHLSK